jgi:gamma-butyrobetaine dioxygenase
MYNTKSEIDLHDNGLTCLLEPGQRAYFNYFWLRDNCSTSFDPTTRERIFDIFSLTQPPIVETAQIIGVDLHIVWKEGAHETIHSLAFLKQYSNGKPRADVASITREFWYSEYYPSIHRFDHNQLKADPKLVKDWAECILKTGISIVTNMPATKSGLLSTAHLLGYVRPTFFDKTFEVKIHLIPVNLAFTASALELHTDLPAEELAPGIQYLHCLANSVQGGDSLFIDGAAVAEDFRLSNPEDFAILSKTYIPFCCAHDRFDMRARQRVIELDQKGNVSGLTISGHLKDIFDHDQQLLDDYYPSLWRFGQLLNNPKYVMRFRLNAGECIVFDNHRIVHGREGFVSNSGKRHLRGCYTDTGELRSTYRTLEFRQKSSVD